MYHVTLKSINRQFDKTASSELPSEIYTTDKLEPGVAHFSTVFKDLLCNKKCFMARGTELTTGLVLFSVLNVANEEKLRLKRPNCENDFQIAKLRKMS